MNKTAALQLAESMPLTQIHLHSHTVNDNTTSSMAEN